MLKSKFFYSFYKARNYLLIIILLGIASYLLPERQGVIVIQLIPLTVGIKILIESFKEKKLYKKVFGCLLIILSLCAIAFVIRRFS